MAGQEFGKWTWFTSLAGCVRPASPTGHVTLGGSSATAVFSPVSRPRSGRG